MVSGNDSGQRPTEFDMGVSTLQRLNYLLWVCNEAQSRDNVREWYSALKTLHKECTTYMKDDDDVDHYRQQAEEDYTEYLDWAKKPAHSRQPNPPRSIFDTLYDWEVALRNIMDREELIMKRSQDPAEAIQ